MKNTKVIILFIIAALVMSCSFTGTAKVFFAHPAFRVTAKVTSLSPDNKLIGINIIDVLRIEKIGAFGKSTDERPEKDQSFAAILAVKSGASLPKVGQIVEGVLQNVWDGKESEAYHFTNCEVIAGNILSYWIKYSFTKDKRMARRELLGHE